MSPHPQAHGVATVAVLGAALLFGTTGTAQALADVQASPAAVGAARIVLGGGLLGLITLFAAKVGSKNSRHLSSQRITAKNLWFLLIGAVGTVAYQPLFFAGTASNGVAIGTVVALGSAPVITGALDSIMRRRRPSLAWSLATALALIGVALVGNVSGASQVSLGGLFASLGAGASFSIYTLASKALLDAGWQASHTIGSVFGVAAVLSVPVLVFAGTADLLTARGLALTAWLGLAATAVAHLLFGWGLGKLSAPTVSTLTLAEPLTATVLGLAVLGETVTGLAVAGLITLAAGIAILTLWRSKTASKADAGTQAGVDTQAQPQ